jgi:hypothetical protein
MNLEDLTLKQLKDVATLFNNKDKSNDILQQYVGRYVIVRTRNEGVLCGVVKNLDNTAIILKETRRLFYHEPKDKSTSWYEGVSQSGLSENSKISCCVEEKAIIEDYSITLCTIEAEKSLRTHKSHAQN